MATITIARKHPSGNISFCIYLVDLACLGVKDSGFKYNISSDFFNDFIEDMIDKIPVSLVSYELDDEIITDYYSALLDDLTVKTKATEELPNSLFQGIKNIDGKELTDMLEEAIKSIVGNKKATSTITKFGKKTGDVPLLKYLQLFNLYIRGDSKFEKTIEECYRKYPDYFLIKVLWYEYLFDNKGDEKAFGKLKGLLHNKNLVITEYEYSEFVVKYAVICYKIYIEFSFDKCVALEDFFTNNIKEVVFPYLGMREILNVVKIKEMVLYLSETINNDL